MYRVDASIELELENYGFSTSEIEIVLEYQKRLPVLQEDNDHWIDARVLWEQLGIKSEYTNWIKQQIDDIGLEKDRDYRFLTLKSKTSELGGRPTKDYLIKIRTAKEIAMIAGVKGGRTSKHLKETSSLARKYFIIIEEAYKLRKDWNYDRADTLVQYTGLQQSFIKHRAKLLDGLPDWAKNRVQVADFWTINDAIIGMKANEFRNLMGLSKSESIRNAFTEEQLEYVSELEKFDSDLISVLHIYNFDERHDLLIKKFISIAG